MSRALRALAWVAPRAAMSRARALVALEQVRAYEGARVGRRGTSFMAGSTSANVEIGSALSRLRDRSREVARNTWAGQRILDVSVGHAIGTGITAVPDTGSDRSDRQLGDAWKEWCASADVEGVNSFEGLQALALRSMLEGGDTAIRRVRLTSAERRGPVQIALQVLEGDFIDATRDGAIFDGKKSRLGVGLAPPWGRRTGLWLHTEHPGDRTFYGSPYVSEFIDVADVAHLYRPLRPGQIRGVPVFAPILMTARDIADLLDAITIKMRTEACFGAFVQMDPELGGAIGGDQLISGSAVGLGDQRRIDEMRPGMINYMRPGEKVSFAQPSGTGQYEPVLLQQFYGMAAGAGITFDQLTGDMRRANYSSMKAGRIEQRRLTEQLQWLTIVPQVMQPTTNWFVEAALMGGVLKPRKGGYRFKYVMPSIEPLDPRKDLEADILAVRSGRLSPQEFIAGWGRDWREVVDDFESFLKIIDDKKLVFDIDPRRTSRVGVAQGYASDDEHPLAPSGGQHDAS